jgi:cellobiose phosphorylase
LARNAWAGNFAEKIAFMACGSPTQSVTSNRAEFLGEHGSISMPAAMRLVRLSDCAGPGFDPCAAIMTELTLAPGETKEEVFVLGQADSL